MKVKIIFIFIMSLFITIAFQNISMCATVSTPTSNEQFINTILGENVTVSNLSIIGDNLQKGIFEGAQSIIGFDDGIVISTGDATKVFSKSSDMLSKAYNTSGDTDLNSLVTGETNDAAIIEFDTIPNSNKLSFKYVFASEEFNQPPKFNDVFALYINGKNIAYLPNTTTAVTIQSVKNSNENHIDNSSGDDFAFLGYTKVFNCETTVTPGQTVHIKIAIADICDCGFDSAVFIKADSLRYSAADAPEIREIKPNYLIGEKVKVNMENSGTICIVPEGNYTYSTDINNVTNKLSYPYNSGELLLIDTLTLPVGSYVVYLIDENGVLSNPSNIINISPKSYTISKNAINGTFNVDKETANEGNIITINGITPNENYILNQIKILKASDNSDVTSLVSYNATNNTFTMPSYNVFITAEFKLIYSEKTITKTEESSTVSIKGTLSGNPELVITKTEKGNEGYNSLITLVKEDKEVIGSYDVSVIGGDYEGELELTFTVGKQYEGDVVTIYHKKANGEVETKTATVKDGKVTIIIEELSPFMLVTDKEVDEKKDTTPKTGTYYFTGIAILIICLSILGITKIKKRKEE